MPALPDGHSTARVQSGKLRLPRSPPMSTETSTTAEPQAEQRPTDLAASPRRGWRRKLLALACLIVIPAGVYAVSGLQEDTYEASAVVQVKGASVDTFLLIGETPVNSPPL